MIRGLYFQKPWDELIIYGFYDKVFNKHIHKVIEIRNYNINIRGDIIILGTKVNFGVYHFLEERLKLPTINELKSREQQVIGIIEFIDCQKLSYEDFEILKDKHYNDLSWYDIQKTHGILLSNPRIIKPSIPYLPYGVRGQKFVNIPHDLENKIFENLIQ